jgi:hypothetical protein
MKGNNMFIEAVKMKSVGTKISGMDVVVTTAGKRTKVDGTWEQKLGLTDTTGHIWAILVRKENIPIVKSNELMISDSVIEEFETKGGAKDKRLRITGFERKTQIGEPETGKTKFEGIIEPLVEKILERYDIAATDALWPCTHKTKDGAVRTNWIIYHRYCEQIAAKAGIIFSPPEIVVNDQETNTVVLLVTGQLGHVKEWSFGEASPKTTFLSYYFAMAEKRAKDRVILKLAGFHGMVYSDVEEEWSTNK